VLDAEELDPGGNILLRNSEFALNNLVVAGIPDINAAPEQLEFGGRCK
jgi:hypothetical protein